MKSGWNSFRDSTVFAPSIFCGSSRIRIGPISRNHVDWPASLEVVQLLVDASRILASRIECLRVDHHDVDAGVGAEALQVVQFLRVVNKGPNPLSILLQESVPAVSVSD